MVRNSTLNMHGQSSPQDVLETGVLVQNGTRTRAWQHAACIAGFPWWIIGFVFMFPRRQSYDVFGRNSLLCNQSCVLGLRQYVAGCLFVCICVLTMSAWPQYRLAVKILIVPGVLVGYRSIYDFLILIFCDQSYNTIVSRYVINFATPCACTRCHLCLNLVNIRRRQHDVW